MIYYNHKSFIKYIILSLFYAFTMLFSASVHAEEGTEKIVRVGYVSVPGYEEGGEGEYKTGFGYEYFQRISYYTGWKYEYVYGSFSKLIAMISSGELDILGNVTPTDERRLTMDFSSYPEGSENFYLFTTPDRYDLIDKPLETMSGKKIGVGQNTYQSKLVSEFFSDLDIPIEKIDLPGTRGVINALNHGEVDAIVMTDATDYGLVSLKHIGISNYYFAVAKNRNDLLAELNDALHHIQEADPVYNLTVAKKYTFGSVGVHHLSLKEQKWLSDRNNTIRIAYINDNMPYSNTDHNGQLTGVLKIIVDELKEKFNVNVQLYPYNSIISAKTSLSNGIVDALGIIYGDYYLTEQLDKIQTESIVSTTPVIFYKDQLKTDSFAVSPQSIFYEDVVKLFYPNAKIKNYENLECCMEAVANGDVDATIITSAKMNVLHQYKIMEKLSYSEELKNAELSMLLNKGNPELMTILNKTIFLSRTKLKGATFVTATDSHMNVSWIEFLRENMVTIFVVFTIIIVVLISMLIHMIVSHKRIKTAEALAQEFNNKVEESNRQLIEAIHNQDELQHQIYTHQLTEMPNRLCFQHDINGQKPDNSIAILSIDVNGLKEVNDRYGHEYGDELLKVSAKIIQEVFGNYGKCYHISGDEYTIVQNRELNNIPERINTLKECCKQIDDMCFKVSMSVGYALAADYPKLSFEELHACADRFMYKDKMAHYRTKEYDNNNTLASNSISRIATNLSEYVPGGYFVYEDSENTELLYTNSEILKIYECKNKEQFMNIVGGNFKGMIYNEDRHRVLIKINRQNKNHMGLNGIEYRILTAKGKVKKVRNYRRYVSRMDGSGMFYVMVIEIK